MHAGGGAAMSSVVEHDSSAIPSLRGLSWGRVGLVLLICLALSARQSSLCVLQPACTYPGGNPTEFALFAGRHFLFALPMLFGVTLADNLTVRASARVRILALFVAVVLGAAIY